MAMEPALYRAPLGLAMEDEEAIEIEIENPDSVTIGMAMIS